MKVGLLRRLRTLASQMRYASTADGLEWYAREIARTIAEADATSKASPDMGHHCHSPRADVHNLPPTGSVHPSSATDGLNAAPPTEIANSPAPIAVNKPAPAEPGVRNVPRETSRGQRGKHPIFEDDPRAVAECERDRRQSAFRPWA
jgi:hypothetical protein